MSTFERNKPGARLDFRGIDTVSPVDQIPNGRVPMAINIRRYKKGGIIGRNLLTEAIYTLPASVHTIRRLNDTTNLITLPSGYTVINGAGTVLYNGSNSIATGWSGNPLSMVPFRPNTSVQPWMYVADSAAQGAVTLNTKYLVSTGPNAGYTVYFPSNGMAKVRSDGLIYKMGIKEPQIAPIVSTGDIVTSRTDLLPATSVPWSNAGGNNLSYSYGQTLATDGTPAVTITGGGPELVPGSTILLTVTGPANVVPYGNVGPGTPGYNGGSYPAQYVSGASSIIIGAFTDASGNVIPSGGALPAVFSIGSGTSVTVPANAVQLHIGVDSSANTFSSNSGSFTLDWTVTIHPVAEALSTIGDVTAYFWQVPASEGGSYGWKNPKDGGTGISLDVGSSQSQPTNNSWWFYSTSGDQTTSPLWNTLNADGSVSGSIPLFSTPVPAAGGYYNNFNACVVGNIFIPAAGEYTFSVTYKDQLMIAFGSGSIVGGIAGVTTTGPGGGSATTIGYCGQTMTVADALPFVTGSGISGFVTPTSNTARESTSPQTSTFTMSFTSSGIVQLEIDWDYWYHGGATLILTSGGNVIPPIQANVKEQVQYRYVYRSSATGALSNPSPESESQSLPVIANGVTSYWSNDPQVDVVDYYRIDQTTTSFTYVGTGPNDNRGVGGTNTPIVDQLTDMELGTQLLDYDNFEPFPSIDLPQRGTCNISGGVITCISGGAIGQTPTAYGFNTRWLAGTIILIGSPTSLPYILVARPTSTSSMTIPDVPDGTNLSYEIEEPILAAQPLPYLFGPTDNINFTYGVGDPLRPGTLYWCKGSNLDSAPDTNQLEVTDPSEPLVNGAMSGGRGVLASIKRFWVIMPNFFDLTATVTGTTGSTWTLQETSITRGLYMPRCLCVSGGGNIFFRVTDGIHVSAGGAASKSITDDDIYNLFPHENQDGGTSIPQPVTIAGYTIYPPDDSNPQSQRMYSVGAYVYYDYIGTDGIAHTLVFDEAAMGWVYDLYTPPVTVHSANDGQSIQGVLAGCSDGTIRQLASAGGDAPSPVTTQLGSAANYALLAYSGITNSGSSVISGGNIGSFPTASITGFPPGVLTSPAIIDNANASAAQTALASAITYYQGVTPTLSGLANLSTGGNGSTAATYTPGNYFSVAASSLTMPTGIILDAQGNPNAQFVFVAGSTINLASGQTVSLVNGATAANVVFVAGSSFTSVATSTMNGNILAVASVTLGGGILNGRALANNGAVTIAASTIVTVASAVPGGGTEVATAVFLTPAFDKGDTRSTANFGDLYVESTNP